MEVWVHKGHLGTYQSFGYIRDIWVHKGLLSTKGTFGYIGDVGYIREILVYFIPILTLSFDLSPKFQFSAHLGVKILIFFSNFYSDVVPFL